MGVKYGNETVTFNAFGAGQIKDAVINHTDNIVNYASKDDFFFGLPRTKHIGKSIYTKNIGGKDSIRSKHEMENMGDFQFRIKN